MLKSLVSKILGSRNNKLIKLYTKEVQKINALESSYASLSDTELQNAFNELKILVQNGEASLQDVLHKALRSRAKQANAHLVCDILMCSLSAV